MNYGYIRVSTNLQITDNQKNEIINYASSLNSSIDKWVSEVVSGTKKKVKGNLEDS